MHFFFFSVFFVRRDQCEKSWFSLPLCSFFLSSPPPYSEICGILFFLMHRARSAATAALLVTHPDRRLSVREPAVVAATEPQVFRKPSAS